MTGQPLGRGGVFELFIFIIIASRVFIIIITLDHRCDGGDTWAGCVLVCDRQECCYLHISASPVFSPRSEFVLTWPILTNVAPESVETGARAGHCVQGY